MRPAGQVGGGVVLPEWCPERPQGEGQEGADYIGPSLAWVAEAPPQHRVGSAGRRQLGIKCGFS